MIQQFIFYCTDNILFEAFFNKKSIELVYTLQSKKETVEKNSLSRSKPTNENARGKAHEESEKGKKKASTIFVDDSTLFGPKIVQDPASAKQKHWRLVNVEAPCDLPEVSANDLSSD